MGLNVEITKVGNGRRQVSVDGAFVGEIELVQLGSSIKDSWRDYRGKLRCGARWLPTGVDPGIDGPHSPTDAALLLLALEGFDHLAAIEALYGVAA